MADNVLPDSVMDRVRRVVLDAERRDGSYDLASPESREGNWSPLISCRNMADNDIPPYGIARLGGVALQGDGRTRGASIDRPSSTFARQYVVNGPEPIPKSSSPGPRGQCFVYGD